MSTRSAYILFYQRRNAIPAWSASSAARGEQCHPTVTTLAAPAGQAHCMQSAAKRTCTHTARCACTQHCWMHTRALKACVLSQHSCMQVHACTWAPVCCPVWAVQQAGTHSHAAQLHAHACLCAQACIASCRHGTRPHASVHTPCMPTYAHHSLQPPRCCTPQQPPAPLPGTVPPLQPPLPTGNSSSAPLSHWASRLGGTKQHSAESHPAAPRPSPPCSPDLNTTQEQGEPLLPRTPQPPCNHPPPPSCSLLAGGFEARPPVRGVQSRSLSVKLPPPARCRAPPRAVPLRWSFTSRPRAAPGQLLPYIPMGPVGGGSPRVPHVERDATVGDVAGSTQSTEPPHCTPTPRRAHSAGPTGNPCPKSPPRSGEQEPGPPRVRQEGTPRARCSPCSPDGLIRRSQSSACLPPRPPHPMRRSASLGRGTGGTAGIRGRERAATLRHGAVPESSF